MIYNCIKFHVPYSNDLLVITINPKAKEKTDTLHIDSMVTAHTMVIPPFFKKG
jgi:hypothetical protein